jgi:hypothetical protein
MHWWIIEITPTPGNYSFNFFGTEKQAEERRANKEKWDHFTTTKRRGREVKKNTFDW